MIETLQILWSIIKIARRAYVTYFDDNPGSSRARADVLKKAMEAIDEGDVLKLNASIEYFDRLSNSSKSDSL